MIANEKKGTDNTSSHNEGETTPTIISKEANTLPEDSAFDYSKSPYSSMNVSQLESAKKKVVKEREGLEHKLMLLEEKMDEIDKVLENTRKIQSMMPDISKELELWILQSNPDLDMSKMKKREMKNYIKKVFEEIKCPPLPTSKD